MKKAFGFTIIELMVVIFVIGILVAVSIVTYNGLTSKSKQTQVTALLKDVSSSLAADYVVNETYPATLDDILNKPGGVSVGDEVTPQYTYNSADNSYCLSAYASGSDVFAYFVTSDDTSPREGACAGHRLTGNLVENGFGENGNNSGFPNFTYNAADSPPGASGSLVANTGSYTFYCSSQRIPIDTSKKYKISGWARQTVPAVTTARIYFGFCPYDADGKAIYPSHYMYRPGTTTTLAQPLKTGDTVVYLSNVSTSWYNTNDSSTHYRSFVFWGYTDGKGKLWPPETYTQNPVHYDMWTGGATNVNTTNNTITLNKPWPGASYPAGHPVSNGASGSTYMYSAASNAITPAIWTQFTSGNLTGVVSGLSGAGSAWPVAATSASVLLGVNAGSPPNTSRQAYGGIDFYQVP